MAKDTIVRASTGVANGDSFVVDAQRVEGDNARITEVGGTGNVDIYREVDVDNDGNYEISQVIQSETAGSFHSQDADMVIAEHYDVRLRFQNTSGSAQDYWAVGYETDEVVVETAHSIANTESFTASDGAVVEEVGGTGNAEVYREAKVDNDNQFEVSSQINNPSGGTSWISQGNDLRVKDHLGARVRVKNTSGGTASFWAISTE